MLLPRTRSRGGAVVEICHQIPGRTRLRVPTLCKLPDSQERVTATLGGLDGVYRVQLNKACASLVMHHRPDYTPTHDHLERMLRPILVPTVVAPAVAVAPPKPKMRKRSGQIKTRTETRTKRTDKPSLAASCPICQLKLKAARWILNDVWHCWREHWARRLHGRLVASLTLFRP